MSVDKIMKLAEKKNIKKILPFAHSKKTEERAAAAEALGNAGASDDPACNALITLLRDSDSSVCLKAAQALKKINNKKAIEHLRHVINNTTDAALKAACSESLAALVNHYRE